MAKQAEALDFFVREDLLFCVVCSSLPQEEVERRMKARPCGTKNGWMLSQEKKGIAPCKEHPETHKHYLFEC